MRALVNMIGNVVATIVIARWEGVLDVSEARRILAAAGSTEPVVLPDLEGHDKA
ncbi:hypothetical protein [Paraburkholderia unamae]|uniref:hypothetical protein n=1 Tax=Paraburkholderia unamae TaxID=219649 RepID=UPI0015EC4435|nr:hypothetical protein [Paraburkholderia unamae]